jgi:hypothetical protein
MKRDARHRAATNRKSSSRRTLLLLFVLALLGWVLVTPRNSLSTDGLVTIGEMSIHVQHSDKVKISIEITNNESTSQTVKVAWYLSDFGDSTPWSTGSFSSRWQRKVLAPKSIVFFTSSAIAAIPTGAYQYSTYVHGFAGREEVQIGEATSSKPVHIVDRGGFIRTTSPGPALVTAVNVPTALQQNGQFLRIATDVSVGFPSSLKLPVSLSWGLIDADSQLSNSWQEAPTLVTGLQYPVVNSSSPVAISSQVLGVPGQKYLLRLEVFVGKELSDTVIVPSISLIGAEMSPSIKRTYYPPVTDPLIISSASISPTWQGGSSTSTQIEITNTSRVASTGQLILQVGSVGDPEPWKDPSYTFPAVTFTVPGDSTLTVPDPGNPSLLPGRYEVGIYVHDLASNGQYQPGDQVLARMNVTLSSPSESQVG